MGSIVLAPALTAIVVASVRASPAAFKLSAVETPGELAYGARLTVAGHLANVGQGVGGATLELQADSYPFRGFAAVAHLTTGPDGSFAFTGVRPDRNTRLRVVVEGSPAVSSPVLPVTVDPRVVIRARSLGPGETHLGLLLRHTLQGGSSSVRAWWFVAARGTRTFRLVAVTPTYERSPGATYASTTIDPPSRRFVYRVCLNPTWEHAMGAAATHRPCPQHDFTVARNVD
jgi:hypothetical protein